VPQSSSTGPIVTVHNRTREELKSRYLVGQSFGFNLEVLPLATTPTMIELWEYNLAELRAKVQKPEDFPPISFEQVFQSGLLCRGAAGSVCSFPCLVTSPTS